MPVSVNGFMEADTLRRPPPKIDHFWRQTTVSINPFTEAVNAFYKAGNFDRLRKWKRPPLLIVQLFLEAVGFCDRLG